MLPNCSLVIELQFGNIKYWSSSEFPLILLKPKTTFQWLLLKPKMGDYFYVPDSSIFSIQNNFCCVFLIRCSDRYSYIRFLWVCACGWAAIEKQTVENQIQFNSNIFSSLGLKISELKIEKAENIGIVHRVTRNFWH